jgi:hypothetical protein
VSILWALLAFALRLVMRDECPGPSSAVVVWGNLYRSGPLLSLRCQPDIRWQGQALDFWNLEIRPDGTAILSAEGTQLIADGNYSGIVPEELRAVVADAISNLHALGGPSRMCMGGDSFQVIEFFSGFSQSVCFGDLSAADLAEAYRAAELMIRDTSWTMVSPRTDAGNSPFVFEELPALPVRGSIRDVASP